MAGLALVGKWKDLAMIDWIVVQVRLLMDSVRGAERHTQAETNREKHTCRNKGWGVGAKF